MHHCRIPIPSVNTCKVSSSGNQILQSRKWATRTLTSHSCAYLSLYDARCTPIHMFSLCWDCRNKAEAELGVAVQAGPPRLLSASPRLWPCSLWTQQGPAFKEKRSKPKGTHSTGTIRWILFQWDSTDFKENLFLVPHSNAEKHSLQSK